LNPARQARIIDAKESAVPIKVLVVDPGHVTEQLSRDTLVPLGCQIITASSTALAVFLARKNFPSLIINGIHNADDVELPQEILTDPDLAHIPVILVADESNEKTLSRARESGAAKVLTQPLSPERFFEELRPYLIEQDDDREEDTPE
jgi:CheY-like chemotaxis protein